MICTHETGRYYTSLHPPKNLNALINLEVPREMYSLVMFCHLTPCGSPAPSRIHSALHYPSGAHHGAQPPSAFAGVRVGVTTSAGVVVLTSTIVHVGGTKLGSPLQTTYFLSSHQRNVLHRIMARLTYVPYLCGMPPQYVMASMHMIIGLHDVVELLSMTAAASRSGAGAGVMTGISLDAVDDVVFCHGAAVRLAAQSGTVKVGIAVTPDSHSTHVL